MAAKQYRIIGDPGSPYSMKMLAILRYRRLPYIWLQLNDQLREETAAIRPQIIPKIQFPDGSWHIDSTPMVYELETEHPGQRSIIPDDTGLAFFSHLIEDMADEWMTKMMYHYRWWREADQEYCSYWLVCSRNEYGPEEAFRKVAGKIRDRQVGRLALVGSTEMTRPIIEGSFFEVLEIMESHLMENRFLFGTRPSLADFGIYGQFSQLNLDPTPLGIMREKSPRFCNWLDKHQELSGLDGGEWFKSDQPLTEGVMRLLKMAGKVYLPFLKANAEALNKGEDTLSVSLMGRNYEQGTFKYQLKCLNWLQEEYSHLQGAPRERVDAILAETGCLPYFQDSPPD